MPLNKKFLDSLYEKRQDAQSAVVELELVNDFAESLCGDSHDSIRHGGKLKCYEKKIKLIDEMISDYIVLCGAFKDGN